MAMTADEAFAVLGDFLQEKGSPLVEGLLAHRAFLILCVSAASEPAHSQNPGINRGCGCSDRSYPRSHTLNRHHDRDCTYGYLLRLLGGGSVIKAQANASHEQALMVDAELKSLYACEAARGGPRRLRGVRPTENVGIFERLRLEFNPTPQEAADPECTECEGTGSDPTNDVCPCTFSDD